MSAGTGDINIIYKEMASLESTFCICKKNTISSAQLNFYSKIWGEQVVMHTLSAF